MCRLTTFFILYLLDIIYILCYTIFSIKIKILSHIKSLKMKKETLIKWFKIFLKIINQKPLWVIYLFWLTVRFVNTEMTPGIYRNTYFFLPTNKYSFEELFSRWLLFFVICWIFANLKIESFLKSRKTFWTFV